MALRLRRDDEMEDERDHEALLMAMGGPAGSVSAPGLVAPTAGGHPTRTADFRDSNQNGRDDRDEGGGGMMAPGDMKPMPAPAPGPDMSAFNTDGFAQPGYTASSFGNALSGWDQAKWADPNHQTPKYVVGRAIAEGGNMQDPAARASVIANLQKAYPGTTYDGKDKVTIPGVGTFDIFGGAGEGRFTPQFLQEGGGGMSAPYGGGGGMPMAGGARSILPTDQSTFDALVRRLRSAAGGGDNGYDQQALLALMQ